MRLHAISAVFRRNVSSFFSGALGYLVIVVFVFVCAVLAFSERFFANNLATLDQLSQWYPELLLFLVPAITMSIWADERKQSTDELLFTLPASDMEILLGKYFACVARYTIALLFSTPLLFVLSQIGNPDWGVVASTYLGYWFAGCALLTAGMFASSLTRSTTVAFVVGVLISAVPVFFSGSVITGVTTFFADSAAEYNGLGWLASSLEWLGGFFGTMADGMLLENQLRGFSEGLVPLTSILYFVSLGSFMLYLNYVVITKRHWSSGRQAQMGAQYAVRVVALLAVLISFNSMLQDGNAYVPSGVDLSAENVHTLSDVTRDVIGKAVEEEEAIIIHAFMSPDLPEEFARTGKDLTNLLRQYDRLGRNTITVRIVEVEHAGASEREARTRGVTPINHKLQDREGRVVQQEVYLGVVVEGSKNKVVIPHLEDGARIEYEMTRSIATVTEAKKLRVGILRTNARLLGMGKPWYFDRFVEELRKQYEVLDVSHAGLSKYIEEKDKTAKSKKSDEAKEKSGKKKSDQNEPPDVLLVVQPSTLTNAVVDDLVKYVKAGRPTLLFDDPLPFYLVFDQSELRSKVEPFVPQSRVEFNEILDAPRLARAHPRSPYAIELIPKPKWEALLKWWQEEGRMRYQAQPQPQMFEFLLMQKMSSLYPEAVPQISAMKPAPKADGGKATTLLNALGLSWHYDEVVADAYQPHPDFNPALSPKLAEKTGATTWPFQHYGQRDNAFLFLSRGNGNPNALNDKLAITKDLREVLTLYPGSVFRDGRDKTKVVSLLQTSDAPYEINWNTLTLKSQRTVTVADPASGTVRFEKRDIHSPYTSSGRLPQFPPIPQYLFEDDPPRTPLTTARTIAVQVTSHDEEGDEKETSDEKTGIRAVFIADVDMIANVAFKQQDALGLPLDNIAFVQNAIEWLAGDERFIELRSRGAAPRTLVTIQRAVDDFRRERLAAEKEVKQTKRDEEKKALERYDEKVKEIRGREGLDRNVKDQMLAVAIRTERERLQARKQRLERELERKLADLKDAEDREIRGYQTRVRAVAIALTPLPAFLLGLLVMAYRWLNERRHVIDSRRV